MGHPLHGVILTDFSPEGSGVYTARACPGIRPCCTPDASKVQHDVFDWTGFRVSYYLCEGGTPALRNIAQKPHPVSPKNGETRVGHPAVIFFSGYGNSCRVCS